MQHSENSQGLHKANKLLFIFLGIMKKALKCFEEKNLVVMQYKSHITSLFNNLPFSVTCFLLGSLSFIDQKN